MVSSLEESQARVRKLRKLGYRVKILNLPNGDRVVLTSKKPFVCSAHHCHQKTGAALAKAERAKNRR